MRWAALVVMLTGCAGFVHWTPDQKVLVMEWFRSGCYIMAPGGAAMETNPMSPVLGGAIGGAVAAGAGGAAVGGGLGLAEQILAAFGPGARVFGCDLAGGEANGAGKRPSDVVPDQSGEDH